MHKKPANALPAQRSTVPRQSYSESIFLPTPDNAPCEAILLHAWPKLSAVWLRSGSLIRMILTSGECFTLVMDCGVMKINCRPIERRAA